MEELIAQCGLNCAICEAFIATKNNDESKKIEIAENWNKIYNHKFSAEDINCVGCRMEGAHIGYCTKCEVRKCGISKNVENCAFCNDYPDCKTLNNFFKMIPQNGAEKLKETLDKIKNEKS
ncbi:MAG: DUF3795 domain-containing protein [Spirochaetes bacterium]|nr:DUF3795 domain-containing protein [Spirochaetota bacterium]